MTERTTGVRVLFTGQYWPGANTVYIARAFERCGAIVRFLNDTTLWPEWIHVKSKIARRLLRPLIESEWNHQLLKMVENFTPDLVYITNADFCWPKSLELIRKRSVPIMCFYHDPPWKDRPGSRFSENITYFDMVATTRRWQEEEFKAAGAKAVSLVRFGYEPLAHYPMEVNQKVIERYGTDITFIGTYETKRAADLDSLVVNDFPFQFQLWGGYWDQLKVGFP